MNRPIKEQSNPAPRTPSATARKRRRTDRFDDEALVNTGAATTDDGESIQDMWYTPFVVSKDTWAVTKCLEIHGNSTTKWSPAHFVTIAMWSGGIEAGIQAAKAIRIFGIWSPHAEDKRDELPSMEARSGPKQILSKIWPTNEYEQKPLLHRANRLSHEKSFTNFDEAHNFLLRLCIGPDLTRFPAVVRSKLQWSNWTSLITEAQFCRTLAPVLYKHFDRRVDLQSASEAVLGYAIDGRTLDAYAGTVDYATFLRTAVGGRRAPMPGRNRETNLIQTDDGEDDEEDFEIRPNGSAAVKKEHDLQDEVIVEFVRQQPCNPSQERSSTIHPHIKVEYEEHNILAARTVAASSAADDQSTGATQTCNFRSPITGQKNEIDIRANQPLRGNPANEAAATVAKPNSPARGESPGLNKQVINHLYEQTCDVPSYKIYSFSKSKSPTPALPNYWKEVWSHRELRGALVCGSKDFLPWPCEPSTTVHSKSSYRGFQKDIDKALFQNAEDDLVKIKKFCSPIIID